MIIKIVDVEVYNPHNVGGSLLTKKVFDIGLLKDFITIKISLNKLTGLQI